MSSAHSNPFADEHTFGYKTCLSCSNRVQNTTLQSSDYNLDQETPADQSQSGSLPASHFKTEDFYDGASPAPISKMDIRNLSSPLSSSQGKHSFIESPNSSPQSTSHFSTFINGKQTKETETTNFDSPYQTALSPSQNTSHFNLFNNLPESSRRHATFFKRRKSFDPRLSSQLPPPLLLQIPLLSPPPSTSNDESSTSDTDSLLEYNDLPPPSQPTSKEYQLQVPAFGHRFALHGSFQYTNQVYCNQAIHDLDIRNQLLAWLHLNKAPILFMEEAKIIIQEYSHQHFIDIIWPKDAPTLAPNRESELNFDLIFDHVIATHQGFTTTCPPHRITIGTHLQGSEDITDFLIAIKQAFPASIKLIGLWYDESIVSLQNQGPIWNGNTKILVDLGRHCRDGLYRQLPGWIFFGEYFYHLQYLKRKPWCIECKDEAKQQFHTLETCPRWKTSKDITTFQTGDKRRLKKRKGESGK